ncbi:MAG TPA: AAA family ATPase [Thermoanaerobaculia bacterium]|jgi:predicted ATPase
MTFLRSVQVVGERVSDPDRYPFSLAAVKAIGSMTFHPKVTFVAGENGTGKSTLLEVIAVAAGFNPEGGSQNFSFQTTHERSTSVLHRAIGLVRGTKRPRTGYFLRAESFFNVASEIDRLDREPSFGPPIADSYGGRSLHMQSHGESFVALFMNRFGPDGLYVLDEPDAALSLSRQFALLRRLHELLKSRCQFVIATHSPVLLAYPDAAIFELSDSGIQHVPYAESEIYLTARDFFRDPARMLDRLLRDDEESPSADSETCGSTGGPER